MKLSQSQIQALAASVGMSKPDVMAAIAMAESKGETRAHNGTPPDDSYGLWQINMYGPLGPARRRQFGISSNAELTNPATNALAAKKIVNSQGLSAWSTYTSGAYQTYLGGGSGGATQASWVDPFHLWEGLGDAYRGGAEAGVTPEWVAKSADVIVNPHNWARVAYGVIGTVLIIGGLFLITKNTAINTAAGTVAKTVRKGTS